MFPKDYEYDLYQISQELKVYKTSYSFIDLFYLYLNGDDKVILPGTVRGGAFAYATLHKTERFPFSAWSSLLKRTNNRGFVPMYRITDDGKLEKTVAYVSSYPMEKDGPSASNVIMIDQARILGAIRNVELFNKGHVFILNQENQVLVSNSDSAGDSWPIDALADSSKLLYKSPEGEEFEVMKIDSARSGLQYVSMVPRSLYWSKAEHVRRLTFMSMAVSLLGGGLLMTVFLRMNYHPVRRLVQAFSRQSASQSTQPYNEFRFLQEAVDRTLLEVDQIRMRMEQQRHVLRSNFITRLLRGRRGARFRSRRH
ncbi:hypothetical protein N6H14_07635 [Paenibacillus sp. CC-CFT747]|nr:hypothetical protein N6H14_07635 [Paenibacillus sp. CC-CFT747]